MKLLVSFRHRKAVQPFALFVDALVDRGHDVTVAIHERDDKAAALFARADRITLVAPPDARRDEWSEAAELVRGVRDVAQYLKPPYRRAGKLRRRVHERLLKQLAVPRESAAAWPADAILGIGDEGAARLGRVLARIEQAIPADEVTRDLLARVAPDAVLATPLVHFGGSQVEIVKAARALGLPVGMLLFSWDNLSTKGAFHVFPDQLFVWNERQRAEAELLHGIAPDRVTIAGAPPFDRFFALQGVVSESSFRAPLDGGRGPAVLYLCSSRLVSEKEISFLRQWSQEIRASAVPGLHDALLMVRPHPDLPLSTGSWMGEERTFRWPELPDVELRARPLFGDPRMLTLTSDYEPRQVLLECLRHAALVVGLNTSAEIEAGIVGRPVFTVLADAAQADGQHSTLHFYYLTEAEGGFVRVAPTLAAHVEQLAAEIAAPRAPAEWQRRVASFVRPLGWDRSASAVLADEVEAVFGGGARRGSTVDRTAPASSQARRDPDAAALPAAARRIPSRAPQAARVEGAPLELWALSAKGAAPRLAPSTAQALVWLRGQVLPGHVIADLTAGAGFFALAAARRFGCTVLALESNLAALSELWQNALINACDGLVVPLPFKVGARTALRMERFERFAADAARHTPRLTTWREHDPVAGPEVLQPSIAVPLGWAIDRWKLPAPRAVRARLAADPAEVVAAVADLAASAALQAVVLEGEPDRLADATTTLARAGFAAVPGAAAGRPDVLGYNRAAPA